MTGLLVKDLYSLGNYKNTLGIMVVVALTIGWFSEDSTSIIVSVIMIYLLILSSTLFSFDESAKWDQYAITLPLTRRQIVLSRYVFSLLTLAFSGLLSFTLSGIVSVIREQSEWLPTFAGTFGIMAFFYFFATAVSFPTAYKFGAEKSRYATMIIYFALFFVLTFLLQYIMPWFTAQNATTLLWMAIGAVLLVIALFIASIFISMRVYAKKEF